MFNIRNKIDFTSYSDELLFEKIIEGNEVAFAELYQRYGNKIFRYFFRLLNQDNEKAEDFLQDFFIKILNTAQTFDTKKKLSTWLYSIATNMCRNEWRNHQNRERILADMKQEVETVTKNDAEKMDDQLAFHALRTNLNQLRSEEREILLLRYQQELSIKEIAEITGLPEGTIKSKIFYLLKKLASALTEFNPLNN